jgi:Spy/CpxP family protein refolding chaperone
MKRTMVALGLAAAVALTATTAFAWGPGSGHGMGMGYGAGQGYGYGPGAAVSTLSAEQVAQIQKIQSDRYAEMAPVRNEMITKRTELQALFREPALDQTKIAAKQKEMIALQAQIQEKALAARLAVAEVLTPEQRAQMPAFGPGTGPGFGRGMGMGYGPRMGFGPRW